MKKIKLIKVTNYLTWEQNQKLTSKNTIQGCKHICSNIHSIIKIIKNINNGRNENGTIISDYIGCNWNKMGLG